jgi:general secretion pathway protein M
MNAALRQSLCAIAVVAVAAGVLAAAVATALSIHGSQATAAQLSEQLEGLQARERRLAAWPGRDLSASALIEAKSVTLAGATLQQRLETAIAAAKGRLVSSKLDVTPRAGDRRVALAAEMTIAEPDMQALLFDLETGRPYLFVDSLEARAPEGAQSGGAMRVSLTVSGQWSGAK